MREGLLTTPFSLSFLRVPRRPSPSLFFDLQLDFASLDATLDAPDGGEMGLMSPAEANSNNSDAMREGLTTFSLAGSTSNSTQLRQPGTLDAPDGAGR